VAEFERDLLIERTLAGLERAKAEGVTLGRKPVLTDEQRSDVRDAITAGRNVSELSRQLKVSRMTIMRARDGVAA
jgi:putative DNA-invertase from lambdoid prophage Rac